MRRAAEICRETFKDEQNAGDVDEQFPDNAWTDHQCPQCPQDAPGSAVDALKCHKDVTL